MDGRELNRCHWCGADKHEEGTICRVGEHLRNLAEDVVTTNERVRRCESAAMALEKAAFAPAPKPAPRCEHVMLGHFGLMPRGELRCLRAPHSNGDHFAEYPRPPTFDEPTPWVYEVRW